MHPDVTPSEIKISQSAISTCPIILWSLGGKRTADLVNKYGSASSKLRPIEVSYLFRYFKTWESRCKTISVSVKLFSHDFGEKSFGKHCLQQARNQDFMWGGGGGCEVDLPKLRQTTKSIVYCLSRLFRKVAIHEKLQRQSTR